MHRHVGTLGARRIVGAIRSKSIGCLVIAGKDFPKAAEDRLREWDLALTVERNIDKLSTRGLLVYEDSTFGRW